LCRTVFERSVGSKPEVRGWVVTRESLPRGLRIAVVVHGDQRQPACRSRRRQVVATETLESLRDGCLRNLPLTDCDEDRGETAHHVVAERLGANRELQCGRLVRRESPFVGEAFPPRVRDAAQERLVRVRVGRRRQKARKSCSPSISSLTRFIASMSNGPCTDHDHTSVRPSAGGDVSRPGSGIRATSLRNGRESLDRPVGRRAL